ncbi:MAG: DegT/DnrJ/EryC1/StrS aminotransferase family protein [Leptospiraceae bacterium]|nr:DegT/DnrJ/EryC1/StrS aminotransferase family protein [Leptospiraceae bacterium]
MQTVLDCLVDDLMDTGAIVEKFEKDFKSTFGLRNVISTNSLFSAYHLSLLALEIGEGDNVLLSTFAPFAAFHAILLLKANPVLIDLGKGSFHMDPDIFQKKKEEFSPKAILIDHTFGCLFDLKNYNIGETPVIEDYSEALGADSETISVGKQGAISICGLAPNHVITTGNGALIVTPNDNFAENIRLLKYTPYKTPKKNPPVLRFEYNLLDFQAAMGIEQISKLGIFIERKKKIAQVYLQAVLSASHETYFKRASEDQFNRFPIVVSRSHDEVDRYFKSIQIGTERTISEPLHKTMGLQNSDFPNSERLYQRGHCVPIYPNLTKDNVSRIANSIKGLY